MKIYSFSVLLFLFFSIPVQATVVLETKIISGKVTHIDSTSITLDNANHFLSTKKQSVKLPFDINQVITLRYIEQSDNTLRYIEAAKGQNSLTPHKTPSRNQSNKNKLM